ncbi:PD40 domain-containing protein [Candidatus Peregrinibacteria bacterium]|nr:PD40 domain-containing protein [Candidatus Peregrinibacteria bacterium]
MKSYLRWLTLVFGILSSLGIGYYLSQGQRMMEEATLKLKEKTKGNYANYIVFSRGLVLSEIIDRIEVDRGSIWIVDPADAEGTLREVVAEDGSANLMPSWSFDKSKIVFASNRGNNGDLSDESPFLSLWVLNLKNGSLKQITSSGGHDWTPAWSPDGSQIAYASTAGSEDPDDVSNLNIWVVDADGQNARQLADNGMQDEDPVFSADGKMIYYVAATDECYALWQVENSPAAKASAISDADGQIVCGEDPSLSPDGQMLYYWSNQSGQFEAIDLFSGKIFLFSYDALEPWISPDEQSFVYVGDLDFAAAGDLYVSDLDGENAVQLTSGGQDMFPRW